MPVRRTKVEFLEKAMEVHGTRYRYDKAQYETSKTKVIITCLDHGDFSQSPNNHLSGARCPYCVVSSISRKETEWLDLLGVVVRQYKIELAGLTVVVDGYDPDTNTVFEFLGDFWHGNPAVYAATDVNPVTNFTFGQMFAYTQERLERLKQAGFNVRKVWESDFSPRESPLPLQYSSNRYQTRCKDNWAAVLGPRGAPSSTAMLFVGEDEK